MLPRDLPASEKKILARTMASRTDMSATEISVLLVCPRGTVDGWIEDLRERQERLPRGLATGLEYYNESMRTAGVPLAERIRVLQEMRNAA